MAPARFLRDYWQKRPLLIRGAFPQVHNAITPEDLAGLACEEAALARIVLRDARRDRWTVRNGPFRETDFAKLPKSHWTLLVQDVDKWDADVAALLDEFTFLPAWRIDDVMISYATDGGGVGAHVDNYDVFLVQARGRRRWRISTDANAPREFRDDAELKLLKQFEPTHDWTLDPGDALYLPPGIAHDGVAVGECMTFSVGMRAPSLTELVVDFADSVAEPLAEEARYVDPDLAPARDPHEIDAAAMRRVEAALSLLRSPDSEQTRRWFGRFITRYRSAHEAMPAARPVTVAQVAPRLAGSRVVRNPWSRAAWSRRGRGAELFVAGQAFSCSAAFARLLAAKRELPGADVARVARNADLTVLTDLINSGHLRLVRQR
ncbi:MAG TPA: cupin domain-containing protein [Rhodanobacteraceae bacterium]|nr:cupin domain-containing protein [Rhodanobacteraceae bacterium]